MLTQSFKGGNNIAPFECKVDPYKGTVQVSFVDKFEIFNIEDFCDVGNATVVCDKLGVVGRHIHHEIYKLLSTNGLLKLTYHGGRSMKKMYDTNQALSVIEDNGVIFLVQSTPSGLRFFPIFNGPEIDLDISASVLENLYQSDILTKGNFFFETDDSEFALSQEKVLCTNSTFNLHHALKCSINVAREKSLNAFEKQSVFLSLVLDDTYIVSFVDEYGENEMLPILSTDEVEIYLSGEHPLTNGNYPVKAFLNGSIFCLGTNRVDRN